MSEVQGEREMQYWRHEMVGRMDGRLQTRMAPVEGVVGVGLLWVLEKVPSGAVVCSFVSFLLSRISGQIYNVDLYGIDEGFLWLLGVRRFLFLICET